MGQVLAQVERSVARDLGIDTTSVQLHPKIKGSNRYWLQQRALDKATDAGLLDTLMGGLLSGNDPSDPAAYHTVTAGERVGADRKLTI